MTSKVQLVSRAFKLSQAMHQIFRTQAKPIPMRKGQSSTFDLHLNSRNLRKKITESNRCGIAIHDQDVTKTVQFRVDFHQTGAKVMMSLAVIRTAF